MTAKNIPIERSALNNAKNGGNIIVLNSINAHITVVKTKQITKVTINVTVISSKMEISLLIY